MLLRDEHSFKSLQTDISYSLNTTETLSDCRNIRITSPDNNQYFSVINEQSDSSVTIVPELLSDSIEEGLIIIGQCCINDYVVWFAKKNNTDYIVRLHKLSKDNYEYYVLYKGNLGFVESSDIDSIAFYENDKAIKVYWVDGVNPYRAINIIDTESNYNDFSFNSTIGWGARQDSIQIESINAIGSFSPGTIQYIATYGKKYMQETSPFYISPLYNVAPSKDAGAETNTTVGTSFKIEITKDTTEGISNFDYINIYSIIKTSATGTPVCKKVYTAPLDTNEDAVLTLIDNGNIGETVDLSEILYLGGTAFSAVTLDQKDKTLFLGNFSLLHKSLLKKDIFSNWSLEEEPFTLDTPPNESDSTTYGYNVNLNIPSSKARGFKYLEWYRFGVRLQYKDGTWSSPIYISTPRCVTPRTESTKSIFRFKADLNSSVLRDAYKENEEVVAIQPLVVYPDYNKSILAQGVLNPTVYNLGLRKKNAPYAQASWFFRPIIKHIFYNEANISDIFSNSVFTNNLDKNKEPGLSKLNIWNNTYYTEYTSEEQYAEFRHNYLLPDGWFPNAEIQTQSSVTESSNSPLPLFFEGGEEIKEEYNNVYMVDQNTVTLNSPDFAYSKMSIPRNNCKVRVVGIIPLTSYNSSENITTTTSPFYYQFQHNSSVLDGVMEHEYKKNSTTKDPESGASMRITSNSYSDIGLNHFTSNINTLTNNGIDWVQSYIRTYPWHKEGGLGARKSFNNEITGQYSSKVLNNSRYSSHTEYFDIDISKINDYDISPSCYCTNISSSQDEVLSINKDASTLYYQGNVKQVTNELVDNIVMTGTGLIYSKDNFEKYSTEKNDDVSWSPYRTALYEKYREVGWSGLLKNLTGTWAQLSKSGSLINSKYADSSGIASTTIAYRSSPHIAINLGDYILPILTGQYSINNNAYESKTWNGVKTASYKQKVISCKSDYLGFLYLGELYVDNPTPYGGETDSILKTHKWSICGDITPVIDGKCECTFVEGDTYYQRYDCLKTYPFGENNQNNVIETLSFMCETRVNLDSQYGSIRNPFSETSITPDDIIKINDGYNSLNTDISFRIPGDADYEISNFPNSFTWSKTKTSNTIYDSWMHITMANVMEGANDKGSITAIRLFNDTLMLFQERGTSQILYNERAQIPTSDGTDIEVGNSGKVSGIKPLYPHVGISSFLHTAQSNDSLLLYESNTKSLYISKDKALVNVGKEKLCQSWFNTREIKKLIYNPILKEFYSVGSIGKKAEYIMFDDTMAVFSGIRDIKDTNVFMHTIGRDFYYTDNIYNTNSTIYRQFGGTTRGNFMGNQYDSYIEILSSPDEYDKIFDNVEFELECFDEEGNYLPRVCYNEINAHNDFQKGSNTLEYITNIPSALKKKFKVWRAQVPRDSNNSLYGRIKDRMRNPWLFIQMYMNKETNKNKATLKNFTVLYSSDKQNTTRKKE